MEELKLPSTIFVNPNPNLDLSNSNNVYQLNSSCPYCGIRVSIGKIVVIQFLIDLGLESHALNCSQNPNVAYSLPFPQPISSCKFHYNDIY